MRGMADSRRINRLEAPSIDVTFRTPIEMYSDTVWREDRLVSGDSTYVVLDIGLEERVDHLQADRTEAEQDWRPSGRVLVEIQAINADTGEGLSLPTYKEISGEDGSVVAWNGWELLACSPRRPKDDPGVVTEQAVEPGEVCAMCGSPDVVYHDADGSPRCAPHVGESPEDPA